jgi:enoyl-CoA hydratase/carnithine racemase
MIELERDGEVFVLRMRNGENRFNQTSLDELADALDQVEASEGDAALVITGEGKFFSNGLDLEWMAGQQPDVIERALDGVHRLLARVLVFPLVTVAAINGHAFAAGAMFSFVHDFRVMRSDRGYVCLPEVDLRMKQPLSPGMTALLQARLSPATLAEALVTGRRYNAAEAVARGLVHEAVAEDEVLPVALDIARGLANKDRETVGAIKRGLYEATVRVLEQPYRLVQNS